MIPSGRGRIGLIDGPADPRMIAEMLKRGPIRSRLLPLIVVGLLGTGYADEAKPQPAPKVDRVGFPHGYDSEFTVLRQFPRGKNQLVTVYGNAVAARVKGLADVPFANGSVIVMETADVAKDAAGQSVVQADGSPKKAKVTGMHVMRRGEGFGEAYAHNRAGQWEFAEYKADGSYLTPPEKSAACAECHIKAGKERDFVYRGPLPEAKK